MRRMVMAALLGLAAGAVPLVAQGPGHDGGPMAGPEMSPAGMLLAHTGELKLSDAQVTRLAAIARRSSERMEAMHASMMAMHQQMMAQHQAGQAGQHPDMAQVEQQMRQAHEQMHADLRDALSVLTPDQVATAFEMMAHHAGGPHGGPHGPGGGGHRGHGGPEGHGGPGHGPTGPPPQS
jgi:Spy/CpxP family protein refolding chaperone